MINMSSDSRGPIRDKNDGLPPLHDIQLVMHQLLNASNLNSEIPHFLDVASTLIDQIAEEIGRFAVDVLAPLNKVGNQTRLSSRARCGQNSTK